MQQPRGGEIHLRRADVKEKRGAEENEVLSRRGGCFKCQPCVQEGDADARESEPARAQNRGANI